MDKIKEYWYYADINTIYKGDRVKYQDKQYTVIKNTGERIDLKRIHTSQKISIYHYNANSIQKLDKS